MTRDAFACRCRTCVVSVRRRPPHGSHPRAAGLLSTGAILLGAVGYSAALLVLLTPIPDVHLRWLLPLPFPEVAMTTLGLYLRRRLERAGRHLPACGPGSPASSARSSETGRIPPSAPPRPLPRSGGLSRVPDWRPRS